MDFDWQKFVDHYHQHPGTWWLVGEVFIIVFLTLLANFVQRGIMKRLARRAERTSNLWDDLALESARKPVSVGIWIIGIALAARLIHAKTQAAIFSNIDSIRNVAIVAVMAWALVRFIRGMEERIVARRIAEGRSHVDQTTVDALGKLFRASVVITAVLVGMQQLGIDVTGLLAFGGIGGLAVGFAAKDLLANFFGGFTIYLERPFVVGEWIRSPDNLFEGTVEQIGWRRTVIRTFDMRPIYVPNSMFNTMAVETPSRMLNRRISETIGVRYDDVGVLEAILADIRAYIDGCEDIDQDRTKMVYFNKFGASSLDFLVYCFTRTTVWAEYHAVKEKVLFAISRIIESHGAEIAFPTSTLHIPGGVDVREQPGNGGGHAHG
ncbi:MAG: mechanosensitive ion channel family protein [Gammaproteobacteria bacterium]|jgi:MscS family membrane protein